MLLKINYQCVHCKGKAGIALGVLEQRGVKQVGLCAAFLQSPSEPSKSAVEAIAPIMYMGGREENVGSFTPSDNSFGTAITPPCLSHNFSPSWTIRCIRVFWAGTEGDPT